MVVVHYLWKMAHLILPVAIQEVWPGLLKLEVGQHILHVIFCSRKLRSWGKVEQVSQHIHKRRIDLTLALLVENDDLIYWFNVALYEEKRSLHILANLPQPTKTVKLGLWWIRMATSRTVAKLTMHHPLCDNDKAESG